MSDTTKEIVQPETEKFEVEHCSINENKRTRFVTSKSFIITVICLLFVIIIVSLFTCNYNTRSKNTHTHFFTENVIGNFTVVRVFRGAHLLFFDINNNYDYYVVDSHGISNIVRFVRDCVLCIKPNDCKADGSFIFSLSKDRNIYVKIPIFKKCHKPPYCYMFGMYTPCEDLIDIYHFIQH